MTVDAFAVELLRGGDGLLDGHAGDEAMGDAAAEGGALGEFAERLVGGEANKKRAQHAGDRLGHRREFRHVLVSVMVIIPSVYDSLVRWAPCSPFGHRQFR